LPQELTRVSTLLACDEDSFASGWFTGIRAIEHGKRIEEKRVRE